MCLLRKQSQGPLRMGDERAETQQLVHSRGWCSRAGGLGVSVEEEPELQGEAIWQQRPQVPGPCHGVQAAGPEGHLRALGWSPLPWGSQQMEVLGKGGTCMRAAFAIQCACALTRSCPTPCGPMDCNLPGSSAHGLLQSILQMMPQPGKAGRFRRLTKKTK